MLLKPSKKPYKHTQPLSDRGRKSGGYSLIEMMVVMGVIVLIGISSLPNVFSQNDRANLDHSAQLIRQTIIDAYTRSLAPTQNDQSRTSQIYQVVFGNFPNGAGSQSGSYFTVDGSLSTNKVTLERGLARCDSGDVQGAFTSLKTITLPRGIYISSFFPTDQSIAETNQSVIRFASGVDGFQCGSAKQPNISSNNFSNDYGWVGVDKSLNQKALARYLVIELSADKVPDHRYVIMDRLTKEVSAVNSNPQSYFSSNGDSAVPTWTSIANSDDMQFSLDCRANDSDIVLSFKRAKDRASDTDPGDSNLAVYYTIEWDLHNGSGYVPLTIKYFNDLSHDQVRLALTTTSLSVASQPSTVSFKITAIDSYGNDQKESTPADPLLRQWKKDFSPSCGSGPVTGVDDVTPTPVPPQDDPGGNSQSCGPTAYQPENWFMALMQHFEIINSAQAAAAAVCGTIIG